MNQPHFVFCSLSAWLKGVWYLALENHYAVSISSAIITGSLAVGNMVFEHNYFGTTNLVLSLVLITVGLNTGFGIWKTKHLSRVFLEEAYKHEEDSVKRKMLLKRSAEQRFEMKKLNFVFFKCFSFLGYLVFAKALLTDTDGSAPTVIQVLDFSTEILIKVPLAVFWYYEFKSIGENSEVIFNKKASIFTIVEGIFELRIFNFFGKNPVPSNPELNNENHE